MFFKISNGIKRKICILLSVVLVMGSLPYVAMTAQTDEVVYPVLFELPLDGIVLFTPNGTTNYRQTVSGIQHFRWYCDYPYWGGTPGNFTADFTPGLAFSGTGSGPNVARDMRTAIVEFTTPPANGAEIYFAVGPTSAASANHFAAGNRVTTIGDGQKTTFVIDVENAPNRVTGESYATSNSGYRLYLVAPNIHTTLKRAYVSSQRMVEEPTNIAFSGLIANGNAETTTTQLTFTLNPAVPGLTADDIAVTGVAGKGSLSVSGTTYTLPVTVEQSGTANVTLSKGGFVFTPAGLQVAVFSAEVLPPVQYAPVRTIKTPVAGHYPISFYRNNIRDLNTTANSGLIQTVSWLPDIDDRGFLTDTAYTAVLELEPGTQSQWTSAGFPGTPNFNANSLTWENLRNLPPMEDIAEIRSEYFSVQASGNYGTRPESLSVANPTGPNLRVFITFKPTATVKSEPEVLFFDDFSGTQRTGAWAVNGTTTSFIRSQEIQRQNWGAYWHRDYSNIKVDHKDPNNKVLELSWKLNDYQTVVNGTGNYGWIMDSAPIRPSVPPLETGPKNDAGNDTLEVLLDVAIYDVYWMGKDYIATAFATTSEAWNALTLTQKIAAWNALTAEQRLEIWDAYWPVTWTNALEYLRRNSVLSGAWDTRGGSGVDPFQNAYGYYEVSMRMTPVNSLWTAFWLNGESTGAGSGGTADNTITADRVDTANPVLALPGSKHHDPKFFGRRTDTGATLTEAQMLTALQRQASWHGTEIDVVENCEPVLDRGYNSSIHYGGYSNYGSNITHQEVWMPYDATPEGIALAHKLNIYDGEFHTFALEWSPTNCKFYIDGFLTADTADVTTHWPFFVPEKDQVTQLPYLDGKLGIPQNPNMMRLSVEGAYWSGQGTEYKYYPYDCGLGIREDRTLGKLLEGTMENGGAAVVDYIIVTNGPKPAAATEPELTVTFDNSTEELAVLARLGTNVINATTRDENGAVLPATSLTYTWRLSDSATALVNPRAVNGTVSQNGSRYAIAPRDIGSYLWLDVSHAASGLHISAYVGEVKIFGEIRPIAQPTAGHFPTSLFRYPFRNNGQGNNHDNGFEQTLIWNPAVERAFLPNTEYTVTLIVQPSGRWTNEYGAAAVAPNNFSTLGVLSSQFKNMPKVGEGGVKAITHAYDGANLHINITYEATGAQAIESNLIFHDDFTGAVNPHGRPNGWTTDFILGPEQNRQSQSSWRNDQTSIVTRDGETMLRLGFERDSSLAPSSAAAYNRTNWIRSGAVRTRSRDGQFLHFENAYGYYEARVKFPAVNNVWGAFWLMTGSMSSDARRGSEIDIFETCYGIRDNMGNSANHWGGYNYTLPNPTNRHLSWADNRRAVRNNANIFDGGWHTFAVEWSPTDYVFIIDDIEYARFTDHATNEVPANLWTGLVTPYMHEQDTAGINQNPNYIKLSVEAAEYAGYGTGASGGVSGLFTVPTPGGPTGTGQVRTPVDSGEMLIDYVKVWNGPKPIADTNVSIVSLTANGEEDTTSTTQLTLTLDKIVPGLNINDITVTGATKVALTSSVSQTNRNPVYNLAITDITVPQGGEVTVSLSKYRFNFAQSDTVAVHVAPQVDRLGEYTYPIGFELPIEPQMIDSVRNDNVITGQTLAEYVFATDARWYWANSSTTNTGNWRRAWRPPNLGAENWTTGLTRGTGNAPAGVLNRAQYIVLEFAEAPAEGAEIQFGLQTSMSGWGTTKTVPADKRLSVVTDGKTKTIAIDIRNAPDRAYAVGSAITMGSGGNGTSYTDQQGFRIFAFYPDGSQLTRAYLANERQYIPTKFKVTFIVDGEEYDEVEITEGDKVVRPDDPKKEGYTLLGWLLDDETFDFDTIINGDITLIADWELMPITSIRIDALSIMTVERYGVYTLSLILNEGAIPLNVEWSIADPSLGYVEEDGTVTIFDKIGNVRLTATAPSGISHSITLRIAS